VRFAGAVPGSRLRVTGTGYRRRVPSRARALDARTREYNYSKTMNKLAIEFPATKALPSLAKAIVLGATGYTGQELIGLLSRHPRFRVLAASSESEAGQRVRGTDLSYTPAGEADLGSADVVFCCMPHGESGNWARRAADAGALAIDLSSDLRDPSSGAVYGLPELWRSDIRGSRL